MNEKEYRCSEFSSLLLRNATYYYLSPFSRFVASKKTSTLIKLPFYFFRQNRFEKWKVRCSLKTLYIYSAP